MKLQVFPLSWDLIANLHSHPSHQQAGTWQPTLVVKEEVGHGLQKSDMDG